MLTSSTLASDCCYSPGFNKVLCVAKVVTVVSFVLMSYLFLMTEFRYPNLRPRCLAYLNMNRLMNLWSVLSVLVVIYFA